MDIGGQYCREMGDGGIFLILPLNSVLSNHRTGMQIIFYVFYRILNVQGPLTELHLLVFIKVRFVFVLYFLVILLLVLGASKTYLNLEKPVSPSQSVKRGCRHEQELEMSRRRVQSLGPASL